jgi:large subunit ribosomal protein L22
MKATLKNYRQSPRKVALAASLVRGKTVSQALVQLKFAVKRASSPMIKLIEGAVSNARNSGVSNPESLIIKEIRVDKGVTLKRMMPRARGSAARILKRSSHVLLVLGEGKPSKKAKKAEVAEAPVKVKKTKAKAN